MTIELKKAQAAMASAVGLIEAGNFTEAIDRLQKGITDAAEALPAEQASNCRHNDLVVDNEGTKCMQCGKKGNLHEFAAGYDDV